MHKCASANSTSLIPSMWLTASGELVPRLWPRTWCRWGAQSRRWVAQRLALLQPGLSRLEHVPGLLWRHYLDGYPSVAGGRLGCRNRCRKGRPVRVFEGQEVQGQLKTSTRHRRCWRHWHVVGLDVHGRSKTRHWHVLDGRGWRPWSRSAPDGGEAWRQRWWTVGVGTWRGWLHQRGHAHCGGAGASRWRRRRFRTRGRVPDMHWHGWWCH